MVYLAKYGSPMPWCDEYLFCLHGIATHDTPMTWQFLWEPSNEHRQPLMRLWGAVLGKVFNWDFRPMHHVNTVLLGLSGLVMVLAVRKLRGRSELADVFLPLLVLTPFHYATLLIYSHSNHLPLALWCLSASAVLVDWPLRSVPRLVAYVGLLLGVTWGGGPVGTIWALGLCGVLLAGFFAHRGLVWNLCAGVGLVLVAGSCAFILFNMPPPLGKGIYLSKSLSQTLVMAVKYSGTWMGDVPLKKVWPWAALVMILPSLYLMGRLFTDVWRQGRSDWLGLIRKWFGLLSVAATTVAIAVVLGHGRGDYPSPWESRYCVFAAPIVIAIYFLLIRCAAPSLFTGGLAIWMVVCVGWNVPAALALAQAHKARHSVLVKELRSGRQALSLLAEQHVMATGWSAEWGIQNLVTWWYDMRAKGISTFARFHATEQDPARRCLLLHATAGTLGAGLRVEADAAVQGRSVIANTNGVAARAVYEINVPRDGAYRLCCRWKGTQAGQSFTVAVDGAAPSSQSVEAQSGFKACEYERLLPLSAGRHQLAITWPGSGSRMDVLELTPQ